MNAREQEQAVRTAAARPRAAAPIQSHPGGRANFGPARRTRQVQYIAVPVPQVQRPPVQQVVAPPAPPMGTGMYGQMTRSADGRRLRQEDRLLHLRRLSTVHDGPASVGVSAAFCPSGQCVPGRKGDCDALVIPCDTLVGSSWQPLPEPLLPRPLLPARLGTRGQRLILRRLARPRTVTAFRYDNLESMSELPDRNQFFKQFGLPGLAQLVVYG